LKASEFIRQIIITLIFVTAGCAVDALKLSIVFSVDVACKGTFVAWESFF
jgi:hypothetical protein